jgi:hypothetical protein
MAAFAGPYHHGRVSVQPYTRSVWGVPRGTATQFWFSQRASIRQV